MEVRDENLPLRWLLPYAGRSRKGRRPGDSGLKLEKEISALILGTQWLGVVVTGH